MQTEGSAPAPLPAAAGVAEVSADELAQRLDPLDHPVVVRGLVSQWPVVEAARQSPAALASYLSSLDRGQPLRLFVGPPDIEGRYFYEPGMRGFNFAVSNATLTQLVGRLMELADGSSRQTLYLGSTPAEDLLTSFADTHPMPLVADKPAAPGIWIGNQSRVAPHFDESNNIACVVSGRRRFMIFPTEQVVNLYVGPIDNTMAGQPSSMVDPSAPDLNRFPHFREAMKHMLVAELEPGDAIFIPAMWWHGVEATGPLNMLVNYWWKVGAPDAGSPTHALGHGLLTISHLPENERRAWRALFDHFVFRLDSDPVGHIPEEARGILGESTPELRERMKHFLLQALHHLTR
ncbi:MAG: cupin-like domain-containing protein [Pseudomonadota bacterium]